MKMRMRNRVDGMRRVLDSGIRIELMRRCNGTRITGNETIMC
jgi:hypothetical protein